jgi:hypothetical protein
MKRPLWTDLLRQRWKDYVKVDIKSIGCESVEWINLSQGWRPVKHLVNMVMILQIPLKAYNLLTS